MQPWEKTNILNRLHKLEVRVQRLEAARCEPGETESMITYIDLQEIDVVKELPIQKKAGKTN